MGPIASKGKAGYITKLHHTEDACMVHWNVSKQDEEASCCSPLTVAMATLELLIAEECVQVTGHLSFLRYRTGAYGYYTLERLSV